MLPSHGADRPAGRAAPTGGCPNAGALPYPMWNRAVTYILGAGSGSKGPSGLSRRYSQLIVRHGHMKAS